MKTLSESCCVGWRLGVLTFLTFAFPLTALPQGRPNILWTSGGHSESVNSIAYSPDGQFLVSASGDRTIKLWRKDTIFSRPDGFSFTRSFAIPYNINNQLTDIRSVSISPDGTLIAAGIEQYNASTQTDFGAVQIWRISDGTLVQNFADSGAAVDSVAFSPGGKYLASGSEDRSLKVRRLTDGMLVSNRFDHAQAVNSVAFSRDGRWLASGSDDHTAKLYRTSDWGLARTLSGHTDFISAVAFAPNSARLATGSWEQTVRLWNVEDGSLAFSLAHGSGVGAVAFSPDGQTLASGTWDHNIRVWDPARGKLIDTLAGHNAFVRALAFAPDSQTLVSGSWYPEYAMKLWSPSQHIALQTIYQSFQLSLRAGIHAERSVD